MPNPSPSVPRLFRSRWIHALLVVAALLVGALWFLDREYRAAPSVGFYPDSAEWVVSAADFPAFWSNVEQTGAFQRIYEAGGYPLRPVALAVRLATGIRPTPPRWSIWLGDTFAAWKGPNGWGMCLRPGILVRALDKLGALGEPDGPGTATFTWGECVYGWREGFLVVTQTVAGLEEALTGPVTRVEHSEAGGGLHVVRTMAPQFTGALIADGRLTVKGTITLDTDQLGLNTAARRPLERGHMANISAASVALLHDLATPFAGLLPPWLNTRPYLTAFAEQIPGGWDAPLGPVVAALVEIDGESATPIPLATLAVSKEYGPRNAPAGAIGMQWEGNDGWIVPWGGEALAIAVAEREDAFVLATRESLMPESVLAAPPAQGDVAVHIVWSWTEFLDTVETLLTERADLELLPGRNAEDIKRDIIPQLQRAREAGMGELTLRVKESGQFELSGYLAE